MIERDASRPEGSRRFPKRTLPELGSCAWLKVSVVVVGPSPRVRALVSRERCAALRIWMIGERRSDFSRLFEERSEIPIIEEAGGGWLGDHLIVEHRGAAIRVPLGGTRWPVPKPIGEVAPLEPPVPEPLLPFIEAADESKGRLGFIEHPVGVGDRLELHGVVEARASQMPGYRASMRPSEPYAVRTDLGPCVLRALP